MRVQTYAALSQSSRALIQELFGSKATRWQEFIWLGDVAHLVLCCVVVVVVVVCAVFPNAPLPQDTEIKMLYFEVDGEARYPLFAHIIPTLGSLRQHRYDSSTSGCILWLSCSSAVHHTFWCRARFKSSCVFFSSGEPETTPTVACLTTRTCDRLYYPRYYFYNSTVVVNTTTAGWCRPAARSGSLLCLSTDLWRPVCTIIPVP